MDVNLYMSRATVTTDEAGVLYRGSLPVPEPARYRRSLLTFYSQRLDWYGKIQKLIYHVQVAQIRMTAVKKEHIIQYKTNITQ